MVTIREIAERVGVSATTVSNVIHGKTRKVSPETIQRVRDEIRASGFVPRQGLEVLSQKRSRLIMTVVHTTAHFQRTAVSDPFFGQTIGAVEAAVRADGYYMMLYIDSDINRIFSTALSWNVSGIIAITFSYKNYEKLRSLAECPVVGIDTHPENDYRAPVSPVHEALPGCAESSGAAEGITGSDTPAAFSGMHGLHVTLDDYSAAGQMADYLIRQGFRDILTITNARIGSSRQRTLAMRDALTAARVPNSRVTSIIPTGCLVLPDDERRRKLLLGSILPLAKSNVALFCTSDQLAFSVIRFLNSRGLTIPADFSVCGFDDNPYAEFTNPMLTTIHQDITGKAEAAVRLLFDAIASRTPENEVPAASSDASQTASSTNDRIVTLPTTLIVRQSVRYIHR